MMEECTPPNNSITVDVKVYMHCDACERLVCRTIKKIEGVEAIEVDRDENKITVTGDFESKRLLKKIKKKTGKHAEILIPEDNEEEYQPYCVYGPYGDRLPDANGVYVPYSYGQDFKRVPLPWDLHCFNDENTEACRIM